MRTTVKYAAISYAVIVFGIALFQVGLAAGAAWGEYAMGGAFPGVMPLHMRIAAAVQAVILLLMACVVLSYAGIILSGWRRAARYLIWVIFVYGVLGAILNLITPSLRERQIWGPVTVVMLVLVIIVLWGAREHKV
jgi:hypothetical protein